MSISCFRQLAEVLPRGNAVLATIVGVQGSVPREVGAKMIIVSPHDHFLTIGGGAGEAKVLRYAQEVLATGKKQQVTVDLSGATQRQTEGVCGGQMRVWVERWSGDEAIALVEDLLSRLQAGQVVTLVTPYAQGRSPYLLEDINAIAAPEVAFSEILQPPPVLLILGAGHVGEQLAKVAHLIGFEIAIQDDRAAWANSDKYPQARWILNQDIAIALQAFATHPQLFVALVTRGYIYDLEALSTLLLRELPCRYIGMIGSEKRVKTVYQSLGKQGVKTAQLTTLFAPIGLDIEALTPEEIAISICAELILVRRGGTGRPLSTNLRQKLT